MGNLAMNKAKCLRCGDIIVSTHLHDHAQCICGNVSVCGGTVNPVIRATDYLTLGSVEDGADVIYAKDHCKGKEQNGDNHEQISKVELIDVLDDMAKGIKRLPKQAILAPASQSDLLQLIMLLSSIFRAS